MSLNLSKKRRKKKRKKINKKKRKKRRERKEEKKEREKGEKTETAVVRSISGSVIKWGRCRMMVGRSVGRSRQELQTVTVLSVMSF